MSLQTAFFQEIIRHPDFSSLKKNNNIALIRLAESVDFTENIQPACLYTDKGDLSPNVKLTVIGWGITNRDEPSNALLAAQVETVPTSECNSTLLNYNKLVAAVALESGIDNSQYCAYDPKERSGTCRGDSGSPLQFFDDSNHGIATVVGVTSFGLGCGGKLPGIYSRVAHYLDWIEANVWPARL